MSANKNAVNLSQLISTIPVRRKIVDQDDRDKFEWNQVCSRNAVDILLVVFFLYCLVAKCNESD
jgi:hypothetical protein